MRTAQAPITLTVWITAISQPGKKRRILHVSLERDKCQHYADSYNAMMIGPRFSARAKVYRLRATNAKGVNHG